MKQEQIIEILMCCATDACSSCPLREDYPHCFTAMARDVLAFMRVLAEENEQIFADIEKAIYNLSYDVVTERDSVTIDELKVQVDWAMKEVVMGVIDQIRMKYLGGENDTKADD